MCPCFGWCNDFNCSIWPNPYGQTAWLTILIIYSAELQDVDWLARDDSTTWNIWQICAIWRFLWQRAPVRRHNYNLRQREIPPAYCHKHECTQNVEVADLTTDIAWKWAAEWLLHCGCTGWSGRCRAEFCTPAIRDARAPLGRAHRFSVAAFRQHRHITDYDRISIAFINFCDVSVLCSHRTDKKAVAAVRALATRIGGGVKQRLKQGSLWLAESLVRTSGLREH